jgi:hypothetical protein
MSAPVNGRPPLAATGVAGSASGTGVGVVADVADATGGLVMVVSHPV